MDYFEKNLAALRQVDSKLAQWIEGQKERSKAELIRCRDDTPNLMLKSGPRQVVAYDMDDPWGLPCRKAEEIERFKEDISVVLGFGLGYLVQAIMAIMEKGHHVIVIEPKVHVVRLALSLFDYSATIASRNLILAGPGPGAITRAVQTLEPVIMAGEVKLTMEEYIHSFASDYKPLAEHLMRVINQSHSNTGTVSARGAEIVANEIESLPYVIRARGVGELAGAFKGRPAILVSTGPSLGRNIHLLKKAQGRALIIAAGQALRPLLAYGVKPDLICTIDFGPGNMPHYEGLLAVDDVPLVALCRTYAPLVRDYQGPVFVVGSAYPNPDYYLSRLWLIKGVVNPGNSVAHLAFNVARLLGAEPIIFVGQDLALGQTTHFDQADAGMRVEINEQGRVMTKLTDPRRAKCGSQKDKGRHHLVPGYYGGQVPTLESLLSFLTLFETLLGQVKGRFINATEGGARIKGAEQMSLKEAIERFCAAPMSKAWLKNLSGPAPNGDELVDQVLPFLREERSRLSDLILAARRGLATNSGLRRLLERPGVEASDKSGPFFKLLKLNSRFSIQTRDMANKIPALDLAIYGARARIMQRDLNVTFDAQDKKSVKTRARRNQTILEAVRRAALNLKGVYQKSIDLLEQYVALRDAAADSPQNLFCFGGVLEEMGDLSGAARVYERLLNLAPQKAKFQATAARLALVQERFGEFEDALTRLVKLPQGPEMAARLKKERDQFLARLMEKNEDDFSVGNFARPLVYASKYLTARPEDPAAREIKARAEALQAARIAQAEAEREALEKQLTGEAGRLIRYQELIAKSRDLGSEHEDYEGALACLKEAVELLPRRAEARWGVATTLYRLNRMPEALVAYRQLTSFFPDNPRYRFETGVAMVKAGQVHQGLTEIREAMSKSEQFNTFLPKMGDLYRFLNQDEKALEAYDKYLAQCEADYQTWARRGDCLFKMGRFGEAAESYAQALSLKPNFQPALVGLTRTGRGPHEQDTRPLTL